VLAVWVAKKAPYSFQLLKISVKIQDFLYSLITLMSSQAVSQVSSLQTINAGGFELTWMIT
jgi:hypothetical protein